MTIGYQDRILLPARMIPNQGLIFPCIKNVWGSSLKHALRNTAKGMQLYYLPINLNPNVSGRSDDGKVIPVNTLGRWIFGVPGFKSNIVVESFADCVTLRIPDVDIVEDFLKQAVYVMQTNGVTSYDAYGSLVKKYDRVIYGVFYGTVYDVYEDQAYVYWDSYNTLMVSPNNVEQWAAIAGIKMEGYQWIKTKELTKK